MEQYIPKSVVLTEIEKKINEINLDSIEDWRYRLQRERDVEVMKNILSLINTLEVKEVDLEKEIKRFTMSKELYEADSVIKTVAKHFFELGMAVSNKAQKGE